MLKKVGLSLLAFILCFSVMGSTQVFAAEAEVVEDENHNYVVGYIVAPVAYSEDGTVTADGVNLRKEPFRPIFSIPPCAITSLVVISNNLYLIDELPQFNTRIFMSLSIYT